ncbi:helix-turn-helix domain-containing protein [Saccharothrix luteola]|uniref:helix-turn-helix domain-containing protein n=1 Tax=Saccharothrix luteola TaxID=2893018 RepID=UPI001E3AC604|nr:AraC family transcriptional regulator [Saccharothrix luteola]MCC8247005.1 AraC family transcriptional regulator [Saccharothrix luteola]
MHDAVRRAIKLMRSNYYEPLTLRDVAAAALVSPFHFSRLFHATVGMPPGRYLAAVRLFEGKRLLLTTWMTVADIVSTIGYSSVGTFTTRFTRAVGLSPTQYRNPEVSGLLAAVALPDFDNPLETGSRVFSAMPTPRFGGSGSVVGTLEVPAHADASVVTVGIIDDLIPTIGPAPSTLVEGPLDRELVVGATATRCIAVALRGAHPGPGVVLAGGPGHTIAVGAGEHLRVNVRLRDRAQEPAAVGAGWR